MENGQLCALRTRKMTMMPRDIQLARRILGESNMNYTSSIVPLAAFPFARLDKDIGMLTFCSGFCSVLSIFINIIKLNVVEARISFQTTVPFTWQVKTCGGWFMKRYISICCGPSYHCSQSLHSCYARKALYTLHMTAYSTSRRLDICCIVWIYSSTVWIAPLSQSAQPLHSIASWIPCM